MVHFMDVNGCTVTFSQGDLSLKAAAGHVLALARYQNQWLLTQHKVRGLEFPGGKVEQDETLEEAVAREVYEETGSRVERMEYLGAYTVQCEGKGPFTKAAFFAGTASMEKKNSYYETLGPHLVDRLPSDLRHAEEYSFIMKDEIVPICLNIMRERGLLK
ncbi:RNA deprotection pyrophosphohydrolase [Peribacillus kribbensis]|uniref:RNA deprotection pyrophosphohydrolase n=1 Tax=Peribacillus kribbensis TaxID=356658 RepID=UPI00047E39F2|nr:nucleoside triphosphatase YtkD [Peribacillus kribbensis]